MQRILTFLATTLIAGVTAVSAAAAPGRSFVWRFAGGGHSAPTQTPILATRAKLTPTGIAETPNGNIYVIDSGNFKGVPVIDQITPGGQITRFAGGGSALPSTQPQPALDAEIAPVLITASPQGDLYILDAYKNQDLIEEITPAGQLQVVAGEGTTRPTTTPMKASTAWFASANALAVNRQGDIFVTDFIAGTSFMTDEAVINEITPDGMVRTVAGGGHRAPTGRFQPALSVALGPQSLAAGSNGDLYIADAGTQDGHSQAHGIEMLTPSGKLRIVAGGGNRQPTLAPQAGGRVRISPDVLGMGPNGAIYVFENMANWLGELTPNGKFRLLVPGTGKRIPGVRPLPAAQVQIPDLADGMAVSRQGTVYLALNNGNPGGAVEAVR